MNNPATEPAAAPATPVLETGRLRLRPFRTSDVDRLFECARNPVIGEHAGWKPHETREESAAVLREVFLDKETTWAVELREDNLFIGAVALIPDPKREDTGIKMIGYWLDEAYWGRHLMREASQAVLHHAFVTLGMPAVTATCYPDNGRSHGLLARLGFRAEGTLHMASRDGEGRLCDLLSFFMTKDDFNNYYNI